MPTSLMQARIKTITSKHNMEDSPPEVANLISHAVQERLKTLVEKLSTVAQHRIDLLIKVIILVHILLLQYYSPFHTALK